MAPTYHPGGTYNFLPLGPPHRYQTTTILVSVYTQPRRHSCPWRFFTPKDMEDSIFFYLLDFESMAAPARAHPLIPCTAYKQTTPLLSLACYLCPHFRSARLSLARGAGTQVLHTRCPKLSQGMCDDSVQPVCRAGSCVRRAAG